MSGQVVASARATFMDGRSRWEASKSLIISNYTHRPLEWRVAQLQALLRCQVRFSAFSRLCPILAEQGVMTKMKTYSLRHWPKT